MFGPADVARIDSLTVAQAWLPLVMLGASLLGSWLGGRKNKKQKALEEQQTQNAALMQERGKALENEFGQMSESFFNQGRGVRRQAGFAQPMNYWQALLGGDRGKMMNAVAPQRAMLAETYGGARRGLQRSRLRGAQRDEAEQELNRQEVGQTAGLTQGLQGEAAQQMSGLEQQIQAIMQGYSGLGLNAKAQGADALARLLTGSAYTTQGLLDHEENARQARSQAWGSAANAAGGLLGGWMNNRWGAGAGAAVPAMRNTMGAVAPTLPNWRLPQASFQQPFGGANGGNFMTYQSMMNPYGYGLPGGRGF